MTLGDVGLVSDKVVKDLVPHDPVPALSVRLNLEGLRSGPLFALLLLCLGLSF